MDDERKLSEQSQEDLQRGKDYLSDVGDIAKKIAKQRKNQANQNGNNNLNLNDKSAKNKGVEQPSDNNSDISGKKSPTDENGSGLSADGKGKDVKAPSANGGQGAANAGEVGGSVAAEGTGAGANVGASVAAEGASTGASAGAGAGAATAVEGASAAAAPETGGVSLLVGAAVGLIKYIVIALIIISVLLTVIVTYITSYPQILWTTMFGKDTTSTSMEYWEEDRDWAKEEKENGKKIHGYIIDTAEELGDEAKDTVDDSQDTNLYEYDFYNDAKTLTAMSALVEEVYMNYKLDTMDEEGYVEDDRNDLSSDKNSTKTIDGDEGKEHNSWLAEKFNWLKEKVNNVVNMIKFSSYQKKIAKAYKTREVLKKVKKATKGTLLEYDGNYVGKKNKNKKYIALSDAKKTELIVAMLSERFKKEDDNVKKKYVDEYGTLSEVKGATSRLDMILENLSNKSEQHYFVEQEEEYDFYGAKELPKSVKKHEKLIAAGIDEYLKSLKNNRLYKKYSKYDKKLMVRLMEAIAVRESGGTNSNLMGINPKYLPDGVQGDELRKWSARKSAQILFRVLSYAKVKPDFSNLDRVEIAVQSYNFDGEIYIDWIDKNYKGKQTKQAIEKYSKTHSIGTADYLPSVMPYFVLPTKWAYPVPSCHTISCGFYGYTNHNGTDFSCGGVYGKPIVASADGIVTRKRELDYSYGYHVFIYHPASKIYTQYCHMSKIVTKEGAHVKQGEVIGYVGSTGHSTGPHCHFGMFKETRGGREYLNPETYLKKK